MHKQRHVILGLSWAVFAVIFFPIAGSAATETSSTADRSAPPTANINAKAAVSAATALNQVKAPGTQVASVPASSAERKLIGTEGTRTFNGKTFVTTDPQAITEGGIPTREKVRKGVATGGVLQVRGGANAQIGVAQEKNDAYFILDPKVRLENVSKLSEIKRGDIVKVRYEERYLEGDKSLFNKRIVKEIIFLKKKPAEPVEAAPVAEKEYEA